MSAVTVISPVYRNADSLAGLVGRLAAALAGRDWRLMLVVDASPDDSLHVARGLAAADERVDVLGLAANVGQHRALAAGLRAAGAASAWVCLDADLQDPPEAVPLLLDRLAVGDVGAVFAGRRGRYESGVRMVTGRAHRAVLGGITGLPSDAGAFVALRAEGRSAILRSGGAPSIVAAIGVARIPVASIPVARERRELGTSAWTASARLRQSARTLAWAASQRWTSTSE